MDDEDMSILATNKRQLTLVYNSQTSLGKQTLGYVQGADDRILTIDISKTKLGDTAWVSIADGLNKPLHELFAKDLPELPEVDASGFDTDDLLKLLQKNPGFLQKPIAINGDKYMQVQTPSEVMRFFDADTAGLEKKDLGTKPATQPDTEDDKFI
jgi:arsenate reductase-like glutaredoxin family protein